MNKTPVIVVGAPRSGTSLIQKIIREHEGFRSVAKESDFIWSTYCHPSLQNWRYEGCPASRLTEELADDIRRQFHRYTFSSKLWNKADRFNIHRYKRSPLVAPILRYGYFALARTAQLSRELIPRSAEADGRLVDKSVHFSLFLNLINYVFTDAIYIHIVRNARKTVPSMLDSWLNPKRFFTYRIPGGLQIPDYPYDDWNFGLPPGWENYRDRYLADVVAYQWVHFQQAILLQLDKPEFKHRLLRIKIEDLTNEPRMTLRRISDFIGVPWSPYFERLSNKLPEVNARPKEHKNDTFNTVSVRMERMSRSETATLDRINRALGYEP